MIKEHKKGIANCFNQAADSYNQFAKLQYRIGKTLINKLLDHCDCVKQVADIGAGTGMLTKELAQYYPQANYYLVDFADRLLSQYQQDKKIAVQRLCADFDALPFASEQIDLVFSNMSLQWSLDFSSSLTELLGVTAPGGLLAMSLPIAGTLIELAHSHNINHFLSANEIMHQLRKFPVTICQSEEKIYQEKYKNQFGLLRFLKKTGAFYYLPQKLKTKKQEKINNSLTSASFKIYFLILRKL